MINTSLTPNQKQYDKKPTILAKASGIAVGAAAGAVPLVLGQLLFGEKSLKNMQNLSSRLTKDEVSLVEKAAAKTLEDSGLAGKGLQIVKANHNAVKDLQSLIDKDLGLIYKMSPEFVQNGLLDFYSKMFLKGNNAAFLPSSNKILMPPKGLELSVFHEIGHAINRNFSKFWKALQHCRSVSSIAPVAILSVGLLKNEKAKNEKIDKFTSFIKDNAGKLAGAAFLPVILEEGMATKRGNSFAKKLLPPELAKKVAHSNRYGFITYIGTAILTALGVRIAIVTKDALMKHKAK